MHGNGQLRGPCRATWQVGMREAAQGAELVAEVEDRGYGDGLGRGGVGWLCRTGGVEAPIK